MQKIVDNWKNGNLQPQVFSLLFVTIILVTISIIIYFKVKKQSVEKAPKGFLLAVEQYVMGVENAYGDVTENRISKPAPYIFTLFTFLAFANIMGLIGIEPPTTSYSTTFTLAIVSWLGIYVVGIIYKRMHFFKKFLNPIEMVGQFAPLISLSFRLWGNIISGSTIVYISYVFLGWVSQFIIPVLEVPNLLGSIIMAPFHLYFDLFTSLVQAYVFTLLTTVYWTIEAEEGQEIYETKKAKTEKLKTEKLLTK